MSRFMYTENFIFHFVLLLTFCQKKVSERDVFNKVSARRDGRTKRWHTLCRVDHDTVRVSLLIVSHQRKDVVEMRPHAGRVKGQSGFICLFVVFSINVNNDNYVVANVTFSLQLREREKKRKCFVKSAEREKVGMLGKGRSKKRFSPEKRGW